jgi:hypothetical protein
MLAMLILPLALMQQPAAGQTRPAAVPSTALVLPTDDPRTARDTALAAVNFIAARVADVRGSLERMQRSLINEPPERSIEAAGMLRGHCDALAGAARRAPRVLCLDCLAPELRAPVRDYRAMLPQLARAADRCAAEIGRLARGEPAAAQARLSAGFPARRAELVGGLRIYEARLGAVIRAMPRPNAPAAPARPRRTPR